LETKDVILSALYYEPNSKLIIMGTQSGNITFFDLDTFKQAQNMSFDCEEISDICGLGDTPFICVGNVGGEFSIISLPPMWYKYTRIF